MPLIEANEPLQKRPAVILLHGDPGVCKTSLVATCRNPLLVDADRGVARSWRRKTTLAPSDWEEVLDHERKGTFAKYSTIGLDTAKAILDDFLMPYVVRQDYTLQKNKLKAYGAIGDSFKLFVNNRRLEEADLLLLAHTVKDGDNKKMMPDITGGSYQLLLRIADQVGYVTVENNMRVIYWEPTDAYVGKNVAALPKTVIPDKNDPAFATFGAELFEKVRDAIHAMSEEQREALEKSEKYQREIQAAAGPEDLTMLMPIMEELPEYLKAPLRKLVRDKCAEAGWEWDKDSNCFKAKPAPAQPATVTPPVPPAPPAANGATDAKSLLFDEVKAALSDTPGYDAKAFRQKFKTVEDLEAVLRTAIDMKDLANLYAKNAEMLGQHPETKEKVDAKRAELESLISQSAAAA